LTYFVVQVIILIVNSSQFSSISFAYIATPNSKESLQSFRMAIAMLLEEGKYYLVRIHDVYLQLWGSGLVLALNREDL
jgi:hypothetical protein